MTNRILFKAATCCSTDRVHSAVEGTRDRRVAMMLRVFDVTTNIDALEIRWRKMDRFNLMPLEY
jgi:hypothetical protein